MAQNASNKTSITLAAGQNFRGFFENGRKVAVTANVLNLSNTAAAALTFSNIPTSVNERQTATYSGGSTMVGTFTISIPNMVKKATGAPAVTDAITLTTSATTLTANIQAALDALTPLIDPTWVAGTIKAYASGAAIAAQTGATILLVFTGPMGARSIGACTFSTSGLSGGTPAVSVAVTTAGCAFNAGPLTTVYPDGYTPRGTNKVASLTFASSPSGTFTITATTADGTPGFTTAAITYSGTPATLAANMQSALNTSIGSGNSRVWVHSAGLVAYIEFLGTYGEKPITISTTPQNLSSAGTVTAAEVFAGVAPSASGGVSVPARGNTTFSFGAYAGNPSVVSDLLGPIFNISCTGAECQIELGFADTSVQLIKLGNA